MLASHIAKSRGGKLDLDEAMLDQLKLYISPRMYAAEMGLSSEISGGGFERYNMEFAQHSRTARQTGRPKLSPEMEEAVRGDYDADKAEKIILSEEEVKEFFSGDGELG